MIDGSASRPEVYGIGFRAEKVAAATGHTLRLYIENIEEPVFAAEYRQDATVMEMAYRTTNSYLRHREFRELIGTLNPNQIMLLSSAAQDLDSLVFGRNFIFLPWSLDGQVLKFLITNDKSVLSEIGTETEDEQVDVSERDPAKNGPALGMELERAAADVLFHAAVRTRIDLESCLLRGLVLRSEPNRTFSFPDEVFHFYYRFQIGQEVYLGVIGLDDDQRVVSLDQRMPHDQETRLRPEA